MANSRAFRLFTLLLTTTATQVQASGSPLLVLQKEEAPIQSTSWGLQPLSRTWKFQAPVPSPGKTIALELEARMDSPPMGSMYFMAIYVNGQKVEVHKDRTKLRLRNKSPLIDDNPTFRWGEHGEGLRVVYSPAFGPDHTAGYGSEAFRFVLEIQDLLKPGTNTLSIARLNILNSSPLVVRNIQLVAIDQKPSPHPFTIPGSPLQPDLLLNKQGHIAAALKGSQFPLTTHLSVPGGGWLRLGPRRGQTRSGEREVKPIVRTVPGGWTVSIKSPSYDFTRTVKKAFGRLAISDSLRNKTGKDLGMMVDNGLSFPGPLGKVLLEGSEDPFQMEVASPSRPTVSAPVGAAIFSLVAEDDALRHQGILHAAPDLKSIGIRTERLVIPAGKTSVLKWSLHALPGSDEFKVVNRIRSDWKTATPTLQGPIWMLQGEHLMTMSDEEWSGFVKKTNLHTIIAAGGWIDHTKIDKPPVIGFGTGVMEPHFSDMRKRIAEYSAKVRRLTPNVKFLYYNHATLQGPNTEAWPRETIKRLDGSPHVVNWDGSVSPSVGVIPTLGSPYGNAFSRMLDRQRADMKIDGFMFDEVQGPSGLVDDKGANGAYDAGRWDGVSAILDPVTFQIKQKIGYVTLLGDSYESSLHASLLRRGIPFVLNGAACTTRANQQPSIRLNEIDIVQKGAPRQHLSVPAGFIYPGLYDVWTLRKFLDRGVLPVSTTPNDDLATVRRFFPFTPLEIRKGTLIGRERIITAVSGTFGWNERKTRVRLWLWTSEGKLADPEPPVQIIQGVMKVTLSHGGLAVLEKLGPSSAKNPTHG